MPNDDFAQHPDTIGEARVRQDDAAANWSPRDVLIHMLRKIDRGEIKPEALICVWHGSECVKYLVSSPNHITTVGMLSLAQALAVGD